MSAQASRSADNADQQLKLTTATAADAPRLAKLHHMLLTARSGSGDWAASPASTWELVVRISPGRVMVVRDEEGQAVAMSWYDEPDDPDYYPDPRPVELEMIAVDPAWRRRGLARRLMAAALEAATAEGYRTAQAWANAQDSHVGALLLSEGWSLSDQDGQEQRWTRPLG